MNTIRYIYWEEEGTWLGYLEEYPDYRTEGGTLEELQGNLKDIYHDVTSGAIPNVKRVGEFQIA